MSWTSVLASVPMRRSRRPLRERISNLPEKISAAVFQETVPSGRTFASAVTLVTDFFHQTGAPLRLKITA